MKIKLSERTSLNSFIRRPSDFFYVITHKPLFTHSFTRQAGWWSTYKSFVKAFLKLHHYWIKNVFCREKKKKLKELFSLLFENVDGGEKKKHKTPFRVYHDFISISSSSLQQNAVKYFLPPPPFSFSFSLKHETSFSRKLIHSSKWGGEHFCGSARIECIIRRSA